MTANDDASQFAISLNITIRPARYEDIAKLEWHGEFKHFRQLFQRSYREQVEGRRLLLVAASNDFPIGRLFMQFNSKNKVTSDGKTRAYLYSFNVMEFLRGHGIGNHMMDVAEDILVERGFKIATIAVAKENAGALRLYERRGYHTFGEDEGKWRYYDHRGFVQHVHEPAYLLEKRLDLP
jgi:ribosomal protein S18 acetylase RimI-like enzyme